MVLVVNGACGLRRRSPFLTLLILLLYYYHLLLIIELDNMEQK
jgi:hypothetical protein